MTTIPASLSFITGQAAYMRARGFAVYAISSSGEDLSRFAEQERIRVYPAKMQRRVAPAHDLSAMSQIYRHLKFIRPDIVHAHTPKAGLLGTIVSRIARVPVCIYHIHGLPHTTATGTMRALLKLSEFTSGRLAHSVLCVSPSVREQLLVEGLCTEEKVRVLGCGSINGVDALNRFNPALVGDDTRVRMREKHGIPANALVIGFAGRIVRDKGVTELVEAWKALRDRYDNLHLLVAGGSDSRDAVPEEIVAVLQSDPHIHLAGFDWDIAPLYAAMDMVVLPTYREGLPLVPLEAAAMELPVVATRVPGCVDAIRDGVTGVLVPPRDPNALAVAIRRYLDDPELRRAHGRNGRAYVLTSFRPEDVWDATYREYRRLLERAGIPLPEPTNAYPVSTEEAA